MATLGKFRSKKSGIDEAEKASQKEGADEDWADFRQTHPGLVQVFQDPGAQNVDHTDLKLLDRLASAWTEAEYEDEKMAESQNIRIGALPH